MTVKRILCVFLQAENSLRISHTNLVIQVADREALFPDANARGRPFASPVTPLGEEIAEDWEWVE